MSIDAYTGVKGGGAVSQFYRRLCQRQNPDGTPPAWRLFDDSYDGCVMSGVPLTCRPGGVDLITVTIGGNDLLQNMHRGIDEYRPEFEAAYRRLMGRLQKLGRRRAADGGPSDAVVIVGNIYRPTPGMLSDHLLSVLEGVNAFIGEQVRKYGHRLADIAAAFQGNEERFLVMGIEPNLAGATEIARLFEQTAQDAGLFRA
jgi:lysophospholipase L1-like esterase